METNNDHKTCYSCKSYIDELENQYESEVKQPELDEHNTILKETSSNNNRCTGAIQTQSQNNLNENHSINANKHETSPKRLLLPSSITKSHDEESISAKLRELRLIRVRCSSSFFTIRFHFYFSFAQLETFLLF
jgi:hypothetical protein